MLPHSAGARAAQAFPGHHGGLGSVASGEHVVVIATGDPVTSSAAARTTGTVSSVPPWPRAAATARPTTR